MLPDDLTETLRRVAAVMAVAQEDWWIISSAAVALHGAAPVVGDVDVLTSVADAPRVLAAMGTAPIVGSGTGLFRSTVFGRWTAPPLAVEVMAGFHLRREGVWRRVEPRTRRPVEVAGATLFVPERAELSAMIESFGRAKDFERVALLAGLDPNS